MYKAIIQDFKKEISQLKLWLLLLREYVRITVSIITADVRSAKYMAWEKFYHPDSPHKMNFNVMIMDVFDQHTHKTKQQFMIANNNEVIVLARRMGWLPKRMTAPIMQQHNSVFYTTSPRMSRMEGIKKYLEYVESKYMAEQINSKL